MQYACASCVSQQGACYDPGFFMSLIVAWVWVSVCYYCCYNLFILLTSVQCWLVSCFILKVPFYPQISPQFLASSLSHFPSVLIILMAFTCVLLPAPPHREYEFDLCGPWLHPKSLSTAYILQEVSHFVLVECIGNKAFFTALTLS